jgi:hypothetical protein
LGGGSRRITVRGQLRQKVHKTLSQKYATHKKKAGGVVQHVGPEFKPLYCNKKKERKKKKDYRTSYTIRENNDDHKILTVQRRRFSSKI